MDATKENEQKKYKVIPVIRRLMKNLKELIENFEKMFFQVPKLS